MKTIHIFLIFSVSLLFFSCSNQPQMLTEIFSDGSCSREFISYCDSAFMVGDTSNNPFPIEIDKTWKISWQYKTPKINNNWPLTNWKRDTLDKGNEVRVFAKRYFNSVEEMASIFKFRKSFSWYDLKISYSLEKKFQWFYNYYSYKEKYPKIKTFDRVPLEKYLTKKEADLWFNGNNELFRGMNGLEMKEILVDIEKKYNQWLCHNFWEAEYDVLLNNYNLLKGLSISKKDVEIARDTILYKNLDKFKSLETDIDFGKCLDEYFKTKAFSELNNRKENPLKQFEDNYLKEQPFMNYFDKSISYKLIMPGKVLQTSGTIIQSDTLAWKLDAYRLVYSDYEINAQSRKANIWAFVMSGCIVLLALISLFYKLK